MNKFEIYNQIKDLPVSNVFLHTDGDQYIVFGDRYIHINPSGIWDGNIITGSSIRYLFGSVLTSKLTIVTYDGVKFGRDFIASPQRKLLKAVRPASFVSVVGTKEIDRYRLYDDKSIEIIDGNNDIVTNRSYYSFEELLKFPECKDEVLQPQRTLLYCIRNKQMGKWGSTDRVRVYSDGSCETVKADGMIGETQWTKDWVENHILKQTGVSKCDDSPRYIYPLTEVKVVDVKHLVRADAMTPVSRGVVMTIDKFLYEYGYHHSLSQLIRERFKESGATHISF